MVVPLSHGLHSYPSERQLLGGRWHRTNVARSLRRNRSTLQLASSSFLALLGACITAVTSGQTSPSTSSLGSSSLHRKPMHSTSWSKRCVAHQSVIA